MTKTLFELTLIFDRFRRESRLVIENVDAKTEGRYTCIAEGVSEKVKKHIMGKKTIHFLVKIVTLKCFV